MQCCCICLFNVPIIVSINVREIHRSLMWVLLLKTLRVILTNKETLRRVVQCCALTAAQVSASAATGDATADNTETSVLQVRNEAFPLSKKY